jgi:hypothetical protein
MPDTHAPTSLAAGHLQNCGYQLVAKIDKKFFYYFIDQDMYMTCSWENTAVPNPMIKEVLSTYENCKARANSVNGTNKSFTVKEEKNSLVSEDELKELSLR